MKSKLFAFIAFLCLGMLRVSAQEELEERVNEGLSFVVKLVNPHGYVDRSSYVDATVKNELTDGILVFYDPDSYVPEYGRVILYRTQYECKDGTLAENRYEAVLFDNLDKRGRKGINLKPGESFHSRKTVRDYDYSRDVYFGALTSIDDKSHLGKEYKRMRLKLEMRTIFGGGISPSHYIITFPDGVYSNWIDLSDLDFSKL